MTAVAGKLKGSVISQDDGTYCARLYVNFLIPGLEPLDVTSPPFASLDEARAELEKATAIALKNIKEMADRTGATVILKDNLKDHKVH